MAKTRKLLGDEHYGDGSAPSKPWSVGLPDGRAPEGLTPSCGKMTPSFNTPGRFLLSVVRRPQPVDGAVTVVVRTQR